MEIIKAIIPAAGLGTRFLPYTTTIPKEMIPLLNRPAIHYIAYECMQADLKQIFVIANKDKHAISDYFESSQHRALAEKKSYEQAFSELRKMARSLTFTYVHQAEPLGLGHALLSARHVIGKEYVAVLLPDDIIVSQTPAIQQLMQLARQEKATIIAVQEVPQDVISSYGIVSIKKQITPSLFQINNLVEKPKAVDAPSNLAIVGRYVLSSKIIQALDEISQDQEAHGELQHTDAIARMLHNNERVFAYKVQGQRYDIGTPLGWVKSLLALALQDSTLAPGIRDFLHEQELAHSVYIRDTSPRIQRTH